MQFKKRARVSTDNVYYDLFEGGYIVPSKLLEKEDAERVSAAIETIRLFLQEAEDKGVVVFR